MTATLTDEIPKRKEKNCVYEICKKCLVYEILWVFICYCRCSTTAISIWTGNSRFHSAWISLFTVRWTNHAYKTCNPGNQMAARNNEKNKSKNAHKITDTNKVTPEHETYTFRTKCFLSFNLLPLSRIDHAAFKHATALVYCSTNYIMMQIILFTKVISFQQTDHFRCPFYSLSFGSRSFIFFISFQYSFFSCNFISTR